MAVCHLGPKQFVGSMAFNRFIQSPAPAHLRNESTSTGIDGLRTTDPSNDSTAYDTATGRDRDDDELEYIDDSYIEDNYVPGGGGVFEEAKEVALDLLRRESIVGEVAKSFVVEPEAGREREPGAGMERSATTVTTTSNVSCVFGRGVGGGVGGNSEPNLHAHVLIYAVSKRADDS